MTNYVDDDRPWYEFNHELDGLRKQNDHLREMLAQVRSEIGKYRTQAEEAQQKLRQMEDARAGVKGSRLYFRRIDGTEPKYHYTINGTRFTCRSRLDPVKFELVELSEPPEGLCVSCAHDVEMELRYNPYEDLHSSPHQDKRRKTIEQENERFFRLTPDANPLFTTYVYLIQADGETRFKVGISTNPRSRVGNLRHAAGRPLKVLMLSEPCTSDGARSVEYAVKREFDRNRVAQEWYHLNWNQVKRVKEIITLTVAQDRNKKLRVVK